MTFHPKHDKLWFFAWSNSTPGPYPCAIAGYTKRQAVAEAVKHVGGPWRKIYRQGGRVIQCHVVPLRRNMKDSSNG